MQPSFADKFGDLTGADSPFPWQQRLFDRFVAGELPDCLDIPTGLGKTSVIAIWLLAREQNPFLPRRLVYVVNRRTIVDQATDVAEKYAKKCDQLSVSTLRGALADNREWLRYPHRPAIIVGTVDMIGSRLLFDAYRAGKWTKAMHAGLLGQDSLIVHDEAHLSHAFQEILDWIAQRQRGDSSLKPVRVLAMSATGVLDGKRVHRIEQDDRALDAVKRRIHANKRLRVQELGAKELADELALAAFAHDGGDGCAANRIIIFVCEPKTAQAVVDRLTRTHKVAGDRIALLTGTIRGYERDALVRTAPLRHLLASTRPEKTVYLVSTSAGEVGADFDADHLVCDITTLDSMIQRLGRVNRRGTVDARVDIFVDLKTAKGDHQQRMLLTADWLRGLPSIQGDAEGRLDASPATLGERRTRDDSARNAYEAAASKRPKTIKPHPATLDAWALTSIQAQWPIAPPLDVYLHGVADYEPPRTSVAWRDELSIFFPRAQDGQHPIEYEKEKHERDFEKWIDLCPIRPREVVSEKSAAVIDLMSALADRGHGDAIFARLHRGDVTLKPIQDFVEASQRGNRDRFAATIADQTFILPSEVGGLDALGMIGADETAPVRDVCDLGAIDGVDTTGTSTPAAERRVRVWFARQPDETTVPTWLGHLAVQSHTFSPPADATGIWTEWRRAILADPSLADMRPAFHMRLEQDERVAGYLALFKAIPDQQRNDEPVPLDEHNARTGLFAMQFAASFVDELPREPIRLAAVCHDLGKRYKRWQVSIGNKDLAKPLAKSCGQGLNVDRLEGYRHEFGSLIRVADAKERFYADLTALDDGDRDLALHLIAAHHGRGRPFFPQGGFDPDDRLRSDFGELISPGEIARRYARLQRRFGHWGLAWIESLVMCADHAASRGEEPEDME